MPIKSEVKQESDATVKKVEEDRGLTIQVNFYVTSVEYSLSNLSRFLE